MGEKKEFLHHLLTAKCTADWKQHFNEKMPETVAQKVNCKIG